MCNDLISIIIPVYKVPLNMLNKCIDSVTGQTYKNLEIILVDDGSPDNCGAVCDEYKKRDDRIVVIHQKNKGLCAARNSGVAKSKGKWITFLDGDDWIEKDCFTSLIEYVNKNIDIIIFGTIKEYLTKNTKYKYGNLININRIYKNKEMKIFQEAILDFDSSIGDVTARLIRKELIDENKIYHEEKIRQGVEAIDFNLRLFAVAKSAILVNKYFYHYTFNSQSITNTFSEKNCYTTLNGYNYISEYIKTQDNHDELQKMLYLRIVHNIVSSAISGFFSPLNKESKENKYRKYNEYVNMSIIKETLAKVEYSKIEKKQKLVLFFIKHKMFHIVEIFARIRYIQKNK